MRIAIAGCSGTGKTTLAKAIAERFNLPLNPGGARTVAKAMGFDNPYDVDAAGRRVEFQKRLFEAKREWELAHDAFVTDRSYLDNLTYCGLHMAEHLEDDAVEIFMRATQRYDFIVRVWMKDFQKLDDGIRKLSPAYHHVYEHLLTSFLVTARVAIIDLSTGDQGVRINKVAGALEIFQKLTKEGSAPLARKPSP